MPKSLKSVNIDDLVPGMVLGDDIVCPHTGRLLLKKGTVLNKAFLSSIIDKKDVFGINKIIITAASENSPGESSDNLKKWGNERIEENLFFDDEEKALATENRIDKISEETASKQVKELYKSAYHCMNSIYKNKKVKPFLNEINEVADEVINRVASMPKMMMQICMLNNIDNYFVSHAINVSVTSSYMGKLNGLSKKELKGLALSSMLIDIGNIDISESILLKKTPLDKQEKEQIKTHPICSYFRILPEGLEEEVAVSALQHHERIDGSGYPYQEKGDKICCWSKIIAIAETFDDLISTKPYRKAYSRHEALEKMLSQSPRFDYELLRMFISNFAFYPIGTEVILNDGSRGKIVGLHEHLPFRPIVRVSEGKVIDLSKKLTCFIVDVE